MSRKFIKEDDSESPDFIRLKMVRDKSDYSEMLKVLEIPISDKDKKSGRLLGEDVLGWWFPTETNKGYYDRFEGIKITIMKDGKKYQEFDIPEEFYRYFTEGDMIVTYVFPIISVVHGKLYNEFGRAWRINAPDQYFCAYMSEGQFDKLMS